MVVDAVAHVPQLVGIAAAVQVHAAGGGDAESPRLGGRRHHDGRTLIDVEDRVHELRIRVRDHAILGGDRRDLARRLGVAKPGVWMGGGNAREARGERGNPRLVRRRRTSFVRAQRDLEEEPMRVSPIIAGRDDRCAHGSATRRLAARRSVYIASAPARSARRMRPAARSSAVRFASHCGPLPPIAV